MSIRYDQDQFLAGDRHELNKRLMIQHGTKGNVVFPVFQALDHVCRHACGAMKMEVDILVRLGIQESFYEAGDDDAAKHSELDDVNTSFAASGHLQFVDAGIQHIKRTFHISQKSLATFGQDNVASFFFK